MSRDLERELQQEDGQWPACWKPEPGETLVGTILRYSTGPSRYGPVRTAIIEKDDGGKASLWLSSIVLLDLFRKERPKVGERIGLRYLGKHPEKGYRRWSLVVDRAETELDFSPLGGELRQEEPPTRATDRGGPYAAATLSRGAATLSRGAAVVSGAAPEYDDDDDPFR